MRTVMTLVKEKPLNEKPPNEMRPKAMLQFDQRRTVRMQRAPNRELDPGL